MRKTYLVFTFILILYLNVNANGVAIVDAVAGTYFTLTESFVSVVVNNQVAVVKTTQTFRNPFTNGIATHYAFPLPETASATNLKWLVNGEWFEAYIAPSGGGGGGGGGTQNHHPDLIEYLGPTPVRFAIPHTIPADSLITVELTYVQLLPYSFGNVNFVYPNDYHLIQFAPLIIQQLDFELFSERTVDSLYLPNNLPGLITNNGNDATVHIEIQESQATDDYLVRYSLSLDELGLYSFSTFINDSASVADTMNGGYFLFLVEPEPNTTNVIEKVFTLIIDRSGSMAWSNKITQAKNAASFIVNNLNDSDKFNIVDFAPEVTSFRPGHVPLTPQSRDSALAYISSINAIGGTNIGGAFSTAVPQFNNTNDSTANIIIFLTDGMPTVGITQADQLLEHINNLILANESTISVFSFGIGLDVNFQLLNLISSQNNGLAEFLGEDELEQRITEFYMRIRNPVLLNPQVTVSPNLLTELYPDPLPNLYIGQQLLIAGRYSEAVPASINFSGTAFGQPVEYDFDFTVADTTNDTYQFLTKVWAKKKIENLLVQYYSFDPNSSQAQAIKTQIILLSIKYGVLTEFTIFTTNVPVELVNLSAMVIGSSVQLSWQTATELNNAGFYVQRKLGNSEWEEIKFVPGKGTTTEVQNYSYLDKLEGINFKGVAYYRLKQMDYDGTVNYSYIVEVFINTLPDEFLLKQNYPNPFNPSTNIEYALREDAKVRIDIYNVIGEKVATLVDKLQNGGSYKETWTADNVPSGLYICVLTASPVNSSENYTLSQKMILLK